MKFDPRRYYKNMTETAGRLWRFTGYSRERESYYGCYWSGDCGNGAGWHGFVRLRSGGDDELHRVDPNPMSRGTKTDAGAPQSPADDARPPGKRISQRQELFLSQSPDALSSCGVGALFMRENTPA